jgi:precorrin-2 dehydrogenase/sirohydrochlorin ferrochelatase
VTTQYYMACLDLRGRRCVVVGGGAIGAEKVRGLLACGARVTVVSPSLHPELHAAPITWRPRRYRARDLNGAFLVVAATSDRIVNERVHLDAEARGLLCNVADTPDLCNFILPAVHREGPIAVAVSTGGASPALAQRIRRDIAEVVGQRHAELAERMAALRPAAKERFATYEERRDFFQLMVEEALA